MKLLKVSLEPESPFYLLLTFGEAYLFIMVHCLMKELCTGGGWGGEPHLGRLNLIFYNNPLMKTRVLRELHYSF